MNTSKKFTDLFPEDLVFDKESRIQKGKKIVAVLKDAKGDLTSLSCLDLGCSVGIITQLLGEYFKEVTGVDVDEIALEKAKKLNKKRNIKFLLSKENKIPMGDKCIDVIVCNQVYEHVENPKLLMKEVDRVLRPGGIVFFGARNKFSIFDGHYKIPFIAWLPRFLANYLVKIFTGKDRYDINLYSLMKLNNLVGKFQKSDYTLKIILNPAKFSMTDVLPSSHFLSALTFLMGKVLYCAIPNYVWILKK